MTLLSNRKEYYPYRIIKLYTMSQRRDFSLPHRYQPRQSLDQNKKNRQLNSPLSSRVSNNEYVLRYDINTLLSLFNEMEVTGTGNLPLSAVRKIFQTIGLYNRDHFLKSQYYTFDHFLSIVGQIEVPSQPSLYVLSFVKILANYQQKCVENQEEGLEEAKAVEMKIKTISQNEIERQKGRLRQEHSKIYEEMQRSQYKQLLSFEEDWDLYLKEFQEETTKKLQETRYMKKSKLIEEENRYLAKMRKTSVVTSPWLRQLMEKKKWLIHDKKYDDAIEISNQITREKMKLSEHKEETNQVMLHKKLQKINSKNNKYLGAIENNLQTNLNRLMSKKKEQQWIMKLKMKKFREEATRKLNQHFKDEVKRLRSSFHLVSNH